jgi:hypothetical protein
VSSVPSAAPRRDMLIEAEGIEHGGANAVCAMCVAEPVMVRVVRFVSLAFSVTSVESIGLADSNPTLSASKSELQRKSAIN